MRYSSAAGRWVIAATVLGSGMASIDATVVGIALPSIGRDFHASLGALQWVLTGYLLTLAAWLLIGGALGDRYGRRRIFSLGVVWFTLASVACAVVPGTVALVVTRVVQGAGAALLTPGSLAIIEATFEGEDRGQAIGAWSGLGGVATAAGPLLGGYLIAAASWRWIFVINVPLGVLVLLVSARHVPESRDPATPTMDWWGSLLAVVALAGITAGLIEGASGGWHVPALLALIGGLAVLVAFFVVEARARDPVLPLGLFAIRAFRVTNTVTFLVYAALGGVLFLLPIELQVVDGYSAMASGLALLPLTVVMLLLSARSGRLAARIGPRAQMAVGPVLAGAGLVLLARTTSDHTYGTGALPGILVLGLGLATTVAPLTATALGSLPPERAGLASAVNNDVARIGGLLAVAVLPAVAGISGAAYLHPQALAGGFRTAVVVAGGWCIFGGVVAAVGLRHLGPPPGAGPGPPQPEAWRSCPLDAPPLTATT